jgi:hypothetical protein
MEAKKTISKIAELLAVELAKKTKSVELATAKLENGTVLEAETFAPGEAVFIATADENVPLPVGEYEMEDSKILVVTEEGVISEIKEVSAEEEEKEEVEMAEEEVVVEAPEEVAPEIQQIVETVVEVIAPVIEEVKEQVEEMRRKLEESEKKDEKKDEEKVEMSRKPARRPIKANPEAKTAKKPVMKFGANGRQSTLDRVLGKIAQR